MNVIDISMLRRMCGVIRNDRMRNKYVRASVYSSDIYFGENEGEWIVMVRTRMEK